MNPESIQTWDGYIAGSKVLNNALKDQGIQGMHLVGASHSPDMWYPYLWMLGGDILKQKNGHPTKGTYWFPEYNSTAGVKALEFLKREVNLGIKPQVNHFLGSRVCRQEVRCDARRILAPWAHSQNNGLTLIKK